MKKIYLILGTVLILISGCTALRISAEKYDLDTVDIGLIEQSLEKNYSGIISVSGKFDFSYSTEKERIQSSAFIYTTGRDTLYLEIKGIAATTEAVVFIDSDSLKALNYSENLKIFEKSSENSLQRVTGIGYTFFDIMELFAVLPKEGQLLKIMQRNSEGITVRYTTDERNYSFIKLDDRLLITSVEEFTEREMRATKEYDYYTNEKGIYYPRRIRIRTYNPPAKLTIFFTKININEKEKMEVPYE